MDSTIEYNDDGSKGSYFAIISYPKIDIGKNDYITRYVTIYRDPIYTIPNAFTWKIYTHTTVNASSVEEYYSGIN